jgi:hypothetical protein
MGYARVPILLPLRRREIGLGEYIEVADLGEAIDHAYAVARAHPAGAFHYVEIWRRSGRLYSSPRGGELGGGRLLAEQTQLLRA